MPLLRHLPRLGRQSWRQLASSSRDKERETRALLPFWHVAGYALGAGTALLCKEAAMACTVAVEETITEHYNDQIRQLAGRDKEAHAELLATITRFRDEEQEHHDTGLAHDAELAPAYQLLCGSIKVGCRAAIWVSERI